MPGTNGDAIEEQIFGQVRPGVENEPTSRRYPAVAVEAPVAAARPWPGACDAATADIDPWWRRSVAAAAVSDRRGAQALAAEAARRFELVMRPHTLAAMLCQSLYEQVRALAETRRQAGARARASSPATGTWPRPRSSPTSGRSRATASASTSSSSATASTAPPKASSPPPPGGCGASRSSACSSPIATWTRPATRGRVEAERGAERARAEAELLAALPRSPARPGAARARPRRRA